MQVGKWDTLESILKQTALRNSLVDLQLGLLDSTAGDPVSVPTQELRSHKLHSKLKKKQKAALEGKHLDPLSTLQLT